jgi:ABC-type dipeptide/oligopeptide/nickel transport system permease component
MGRYIVRRLLYLVVVLFVVSVITFGLMHAVPGGPFDREKALPPDIMENLNRRYNLDQPIVVQYGLYMREVLIPKCQDTHWLATTEDDAMIKFKVGNLYCKWMNFGPSYRSRSRTVNDIFRDQLPISMQLGVMALTVALIIGLPVASSRR